MLITEAQMGIGYSTDALALLENMQYLSEAESVYAPAMVPIVENKSLQANIIRLEDMTRFCESNYISDFGAALKAVCEASEVDPSTICFSVQEENVIADQDMAELVAGIMNEGVAVVAVPLNENDDAVKLTDLAVNSYINTGNDAIMEALAYGNYAYILETAASQADNDYWGMGDYGDSLSIHDNPGGKLSSDASEADKAAHKLSTATAGMTPAKADSILDKIKNKANASRDWIARQIKRLHDWAIRVQQKIAVVSPNEKSIWQKIKNKIASVIQYLTRKLHNFVASKDNAIANPAA